MKCSPALPVIGPLLHRRSVRATAEMAGKGDLSAVRQLAGIAVSDPDEPARAIARDALAALPSREAIDAFCDEVLARGDHSLDRIAIDRGYISPVPAAQALFFFLTGQEDALCRCDPGADRPLLAAGYAAAPAGIRTRALRSAADPRMGRHLARALIGTDLLRHAGSWSYAEWEVVFSGLTEGREWEELWQLAPSAPPSLAVTALHALKEAGWRPGGDGSRVFGDLLRELPERWASPSPEKPPLTIRNDDSRCLRLAFSPDGSLLAAGTCDGSISVWQVSTARLLASFASGAGSIGFLAFPPGNTFLVAGGDEGTLHGFAIPQGTPLWSYADPVRRVTSAVLTGEEILAGDRQGRIARIAGRTGKTLQELPGDPSPVTALSPGPDGSSLAVGHASGTINCRDMSTGAVSWTEAGTGDAIRFLAFTDEGALMVVHERSLPGIRDWSSGEIVRTFTGHTGQAACHTISPTRRLVAIGSHDRMLRLWDREGNRPSAEIPFYNRLPTCCAISPDGTVIAAGCNEGTVYYFSAPDGRKIREFRGYRRPVTACAISPDGTCLATAGGDGTVTLRGFPSGELLRTLRTPAGAVTAFAGTGRGGDGIVTGSADGRVRLFSPADGTLIRHFDAHTPSIRALAVSPDGAYLACAGSDTSLRIWDLATGGLVASCEGLKTTARFLAFLPGGSTLVSGGWDGVVRYWDVPGGNPAGTLTGHSSIVTCCCTDPAGEFLVTGSNDTTVRVWQRGGEKRCTVLREAKKEVSACTISPDGTLLAVAGTEPVIRLYSLPDAAPAGTIPQIPGRPAAFTFSDDGLAIAAGYDSGTLAFYDVHGRSLILTIAAHAGAISGIVALRGEDCVATGGADGMIRTFRFPFMRPLAGCTFADLSAARELALAAGDSAAAEQWRFLHRLLSLRFQNEIELCPVFRDAGQYDIQIVG